MSEPQPLKLARQPIRAPNTRRFERAGRVRYAWRPTGTRAGTRTAVPVARLPARIDGAITLLAISENAIRVVT